MCSSWLMLTVALLAADAGTGTRLHRDTPLYCYGCEGAACGGGGGGGLRAERCPRERPLCATRAEGPDFSITLACTEAPKEACSLSTTNKTLRVTCVCMTDLCNRPFSHEFIQHLNNSSTDINSTSDIFNNITNIYTNITEMTTPPELSTYNSPVTTTVKSVTGAKGARAEALKSSAPSDDDEDENEGSGSWNDESKRRPVSDPAAPSSHLPAEGNTASETALDILVVLPFVLNLL